MEVVSKEHIFINIMNAELLVNLFQNKMCQKFYSTNLSVTGFETFIYIEKKTTKNKALDYTDSKCKIHKSRSPIHILANY